MTNDIEEVFCRIIDLANKINIHPKQLMKYVLNHNTEEIEKARKQVKTLKQFRNIINKE